MSHTVRRSNTGRERQPHEGLAIVVAALTFQRPATLERLLEGFAGLEIPPQCSVTFLIVDNDPAESARGLVEAWRSRLPGLEYAVEPRPGIPVARNRAMERAAEAGADALCFIDDDEYPAATWLVELAATWGGGEVDLVGGPVRVAPARKGCGPWRAIVNASLAGRAARKERAAARAAVRGGCRTIVTSNFLCDLRWASRHGARFDESFLVSGGSDIDFFRRAVAAGCRRAWCPAAIVYEAMGDERLSLGYQFRRGMFQSVNHFRLRHPRLTVGLVAATVATAVLRGLLGLLLFVVPVHGVGSLVTAVRSLGWSAGRVAALFGARSTLYARSPVAAAARDGQGSDDEPPATVRGWRAVARLFRDAVGACRVEFGVAVVALVFVGVATAGMAGLMRVAVNDVFVRRDLGTMWLVAAGIAVLSMLKGLADYVQGVIMTRIANRVTASFQRRLFDRLLTARLTMFTKYHSSTLITRINTKAQAASRLVGLVTSSIARDAVMLCGLVAVMVSQDPLLSLVALSVGPVVVFGTYRIVRHLRAIADATAPGGAEVLAVLQETCQGIRTVKSFNLEAEMRGRFAGAVANVEARGNAIARVGRLTSPLMESLGGVVIAAMVVYSGWQAVVHGKTPGEFMAFITAFLLAYEPAKRLANVQVGLVQGLERVERMYAMLDKPSKEPTGAAWPATAAVRGHVVVAGVSFGYGSSPVLEDVSLDIRPGEITALVGPSGAGKSTLFALLQRFYEPWAGTITVDGRDVAGFDPRSIRELIAVVSQDVTLFSGSIADNIRLGSRSASEAAVEAAAGIAAADFIAALPAGYATRLGERSATLSGGQAQRLAIARAVLKNAPILLLDEATSALDAETERAVRQSLAALMEGRTTVVIAHRPSTVVRADRIYVLDRGRIVGCGRHEELVASHGLYRKLFGSYPPAASGRAA